MLTKTEVAPIVKLLQDLIDQFNYKKSINEDNITPDD